MYVNESEWQTAKKEKKIVAKHTNCNKRSSIQHIKTTNK